MGIIAQETITLLLLVLGVTGLMAFYMYVGSQIDEYVKILKNEKPEQKQQDKEIRKFYDQEK